MHKRVASTLLLLLISAQAIAGSAEVNVTINIPQENQATRLYNFEIDRYQIIRHPHQLTREECLDYLPSSSNPKLIKVMDKHIKRGLSPYRALVLTQFSLKNYLVNRTT